MRSIVLIIMICSLLVGCGLPSDEKLTIAFRRKEPEFNKLIEMANQDSHLIRIAPRFTWLDTDVSWPRGNVGISAERWDAYRQIFHDLDIDAGLVRRTDKAGAIFFIAKTQGILVTGGSYKGYAYSTSSLLPDVESLNTMPDFLFDRKGHALAFRPLAKNWYIYREEF